MINLLPIDYISNLLLENRDNTRRLKNLKALQKIRELGEKKRSLSSDKNNYCSINIEEMYSNYKNKTHKITELREKQDKVNEIFLLFRNKV